LADERNLRTGQAVTEAGADWAILTSPDSVCYATGHEVPVEAGPSPFAGGPTCAVVAPDGTAALVVANIEEASARASRASVVRAYEGFGYRRAAPAVANFAGTLRGLLADLGVSGMIAIEPASFPAAAGEILGDRATGYVPIDSFLWRHRATKTPAELDVLRTCAALTGAGQAAALHAVAAGRSELEIFADIRCAMERQAGVRLPVTGDLLSGADRTAAFTGWPVERLVRENEPVIADLAPRYRGYWGDSCNTIHLGAPSPDFMRQYRAVQRALERGIECLRPGITAGAFDAAVREVIQREGFAYPHHTGHGIGTSVHEYPRLVAEETATLEAGMVLLVEPGAYQPGVGGVRLEWMFLVTPDGNEVLSPFEHRMSPAR
jgi:Xaa-Pro dipeptidase